MLWLTVRIHWYCRISDAVGEVLYKPRSTVFRSRSSSSGPTHLLHCSLRFVHRNYVYSIFNVHGSVHRKYIPIYTQQDAALHSLFISGNCSTCFGWYLHPSSGAHATVSTAFGICHTVTATCRIAAGSSNGVTNTRCCRYSCMRS